MVFLELRLAAALKYGVAALLLSSDFAFAQTQSSVGQFFVGITLNGAGPAVVPAGLCASQTVFNQIGAVVRVTCLDNPFVTIAPWIDTQLPGTFGGTFRYLLSSNSNKFDHASTGINSFKPAPSGLNSVSASLPTAGESAQPASSAQSSSGRNSISRILNSPMGTVTDLSIYRTSPLATVDAQGLMHMLISF